MGPRLTHTVERVRAHWAWRWRLAISAALTAVRLCLFVAEHCGYATGATVSAPVIGSSPWVATASPKVR
jgi:hypothetical protein